MESRGGRQDAGGRAVADTSDGKAFAVSSPAISVPKGGGAIRGIGEKLSANPVTGTASMSVPLAISPGRSGFGPQLSLAYDSGAGNGVFGFGWAMSVAAITRKTDRGLPRYHDADDSDVYVISGAEDLVPVYRQDPDGTWVGAHSGFQRDNDGFWVRDSSGRLVVHEDEIDGYRVRRYRPRIEGLFARIEQWTRLGAPGDVHWRSISKDNVLTLYGHGEAEGTHAAPRIADPLNASHVFAWLICETRDDRGNAAVYRYKAEDGNGVGEENPCEHNRGARGDVRRTANRYLKHILYGNRTPLIGNDGTRPRVLTSPDINGAGWMFEVVFDYGEHDAAAPAPNDAGSWAYRPDPFSSYRAGFEVRTTRLCQRVLMFHHFPGESDVERDCLVRSTDFTYSDEVEPTSVRNPIYTFLRSVTQSGYRRKNSGYDRRSLPPLEFRYSEPVVQDTVEEVNLESLENLPVGLDASMYRWTDLHGEGLPGILSEQAGAWYYKRNLSPLPEARAEGAERAKVRFSPLEVVASKPNVSFSTGADLMDLAGDGQPDVVVMNGPTPGLYKHDEAEGWQPFRPFQSRLTRDWRDPNLKFIDLDGDGHADVLISEDEAFVWHQSLEEEGFGAARRVARAFDEEQGPRIALADGTQSIHLADLSGDGLTDIVRIRNGEVCYWPNLGYGQFGAKVTMTNSPTFDNPGQFDSRRIRLADIDGSGTTDIIYLHRDGVRLYFNQSGNGWSQPHPLQVFPRIDDEVDVALLDLLGNGTACLTWSSSLEIDHGRSMRYVNLMGGQKPHLLLRSINNLGAETAVHYAPSTKFYLQDKRDGRPWITRLPFPVHVVERVETVDRVSRNRFVTSYVYHHGYFDGHEREFRGFGMVEQLDTASMPALAGSSFPAENVDSASHVPPVRTKTWFHTGVFVTRDRVSDYFAGFLDAGDRGEYFREPGLTDVEARALLVTDTILPSGLSPDEDREACRALKGSMLRQEVYADDAGPGATAKQIEQARTPYVVIEQNIAVRLVQPRGSNPNAVFLTHEREAVSYQYERDAADPRVQHALTLETDAFGNVLKQAAVGYGRRTSVRVVQPDGQVRTTANPGLAALADADRARQTTALVMYTESRFTNVVDDRHAYRAPVSCEAVTFELTGYNPSGPSGRFVPSDLVEAEPGGSGRLRHKFIDEVQYEAGVTATSCRRRIEWLRTLYRRDDLAGQLPLGRIESMALPGESYKLAFTPGLLTAVFVRPRVGQSDEALLPDPAAVLAGQAGDRGGYLQSQFAKADGRFPPTDADDHWWLVSGQTFFSVDPAHAAATELDHARKHFFLPRRYRDPFDHHAFVDFDRHDLLMAETRDALGNRVTVDANDYRVLQPRLMSDSNRNRTEVGFDTLGMVVGTAVMGKPSPAPAEGDRLTGFVADLTDAELDGFFDAADPQAVAPGLLRDATTHVVYDVGRFAKSRQAHPDEPELWLPAGIATLVRETHATAALPPQGLQIQISFRYSDGFGREIQKKTRAEPGPLVEGGPDVNPRWVGSGWTIFNNKGKPVRQYEPFFSRRQRPDGSVVSDHRFEFGTIAGVSSVVFYDPLSRIVATVHPNHTYEKVVLSPWHEVSFDANDTCAPRGRETGDPRTDPDIGGYLAEYFKSLPVDPLALWRTWHAQRIDGSLGPAERAAATGAAAHADTPATAHFDVLGRPFLTLSPNRVACTGHDLDGTEEIVARRVDLDIEGNQRALRDKRKLPVNHLPSGAPEQRTVMRYRYDLLGNRIHQVSMEAGEQWLLADGGGNSFRLWDSRGHNFSTRYDALRRPTEQRVRGTTPDSDPRTLNRDLVVELIEYGEGLANAESLNLRTRIYRHFDSAGVASNARFDAAGVPVESYDFKGNLLASARRFARDHSDIPNWLSNPALGAETFEGRTHYDALNRPIQSVAPQSNAARTKWNVLQPVFNEANLLERVDVWLERASLPGALIDATVEAPSAAGVTNIDYDAKGQRRRVDYSNGASTRYAYDPLTSRLAQLTTERPSSAFPGDDPQPPVAGSPGRHLQNLSYTHDPVGNVTRIKDDAQQTIWFRNQRVEPSNDYVYDALYRLIQATGREHLGQVAGGARRAPTAPDSFNGFHTRIDHPGDGAAVGTYVERYVYDAVGNFLQMQHRGTDPAHAGWTRAYDYLEASLIESGGPQAKVSNRLSRTTLSPSGATPQVDAYEHDRQGNVVRMPHLGGGSPARNMHWDYKNQLRQVDLGGGGTAYYVYDASGQRVRKVWEKSAALTEERIYLRGFELFRKHPGAIGANTATLERETLHVMDDKQRIALVETRTLDIAGTDLAPRQLIRYQFGNHLGSASLELDEASRVISYEEHAPYGSSTYQAVRSQTETAKRYRYTGKERDEESGLYYFGRRYLAVHLGNWLSPDPAEFADGLNLYEVTKRNPVSSADPDGQTTYEHLTTPEAAANIIKEGKWSGLDIEPGFRDQVWLGEPGAKAPFGPRGVAENSVKMTLEIADAIVPQEHVSAAQLKEWRRTFDDVKKLSDFANEAEWMAARESHMWAKAKEFVKASKSDVISIKNPGGKGSFLVLKQSALARLKPVVMRLSGTGAQKAVAEAAKGASEKYWSQADDAVKAAAETKWGKAARYLKYGGKALVIVGAGLDAYEIYRSGFSTRTITKKAGGWAGAAGGAWLGAKGGAAAGAAIGVWFFGAGAAPGAAIGGTIGSIGGGIGGYFVGQAVAETVYDAFFDPGYQLMPAN